MRIPAFLGRRSERLPDPKASLRLFDESFPKKIERIALVSRRVHAGRFRAERESRRRGTGIEFADRRDYVAGDDVRNIDWSAYQRFGRLLVRLYEEQADLSVYLLLDSSASMGENSARKFNHARRITAALAHISLANLDRVSIGGLAGGRLHSLPQVRGRAQIFKICRFLEGLSPGGTTDLLASLRVFVAQKRRPGVAILLSDLFDPGGFEPALNVLRYHRFEPRIIQLVDLKDTQLGAFGEAELVDSETGERREVVLTERALRKFDQAGKLQQSAVERFALGHHVPYAKADVDQAFEHFVLQVLRRGGMLE
jgi:uncharacterized protein (DUF58 family)